LSYDNGIKYAVFTEKSLRLLGKNQYTFNVESGFTKTEIKHWVELFFGVKVVAVNSHRLPGKGRRMGPILGHTMHYRPPSSLPRARARSQSSSQPGTADVEGTPAESTEGAAVLRLRREGKRPCLIELRVNI
ncbi:hypothetical protein EJB05_16889, partial [Eragrostis curvula]